MEQNKRIRIHHLAKEWGVESKVLVELCQQLGIAAANQLAGLDPAEVSRLRDALRARAAQPAPQPSPPRTAIPVPSKPVAPRTAAPPKPVPAVLVAPAPAPVWNQSLKGATASPAKAAPATPPAPASGVQARPELTAHPIPPAVPVSPTAKPTASPPPASPSDTVPPSTRSPGARNAAAGRPTPRTVAQPAQRKEPDSVPVPPPATAAPAAHPASGGETRNPGVAQLLAIGAGLGLEGLDRIPRLAEIDIPCAVFKIQQITERVCRTILGAHGPRELDVMIGEIEQRNMLSKKAVSYLRHIQNLGTHAAQNAEGTTGEAFTLLDVNNAAATLASVLDAAIRAKRIGPR